jgi:polyhydroxyalkanoate synthesis regulator phasin
VKGEFKMDPKKMMKIMLDFNKTAVEKSFNTMAVMQDQADKMFDLWLNQNKWFPEQAKKAVAECVKTRKNGLEEFKAKIDEGYKKMEEYLGTSEK